MCMDFPTNFILTYQLPLRTLQLLQLFYLLPDNTYKTLYIHFIASVFLFPIILVIVQSSLPRQDSIDGINVSSYISQSFVYLDLFEPQDIMRAVGPFFEAHNFGSEILRILGVYRCVGSCETVFGGLEAGETFLDAV
jgi:hypothetical protein